MGYSNKQKIFENIDLRDKGKSTFLSFFKEINLKGNQFLFLSVRVIISHNFQF